MDNQQSFRFFSLNSFVHSLMVMVEVSACIRYEIGIILTLTPHIVDLIQRCRYFRQKNGSGGEPHTLFKAISTRENS